MNAAKPDDLDVRIGRPCQLNGDIRLEAQHVRRPHGTGEIDFEFGIGTLEFDQARSQPERAKCLGHRQMDFAAHRRNCAVPGSYQPEGCFFHLFRGAENFDAFRRRANPVDMAGDEDGAERALEVVDFPA